MAPGLRDRILEGAQVALWVGLLVFGTFLALRALREDPGRAQAERQEVPAAPTGLVEAEELPVLATSREFTFWLQPTGPFVEGRWSKDGHMFAIGTRKGDWIDLGLPKREPSVNTQNRP